MIRNWTTQLKSPPNMITTARIASTPLLSYFIISEQHTYALWGCLIAGFSDWFDGYLAKNHGMTTVLGTYLDPFADKILINTLSVSLCYTGVLPPWLVGVWLGRDILLVGGSYWHVRQQTLQNKPQEGRWIIDPGQTPLRVEATQISKVNTALQFLTLSLGLVQPFQVVPPGVLDALCIITGGTTIASGFSYVGHDAFKRSGNKSINKSNDKARGAS